jgi:NADH-quinone oxidoreductase subunit A
MAQYLPLLVLLVLASLFAGLSFVASSLLGQRRHPTPAKVAPYECGIVPDDRPAERFPVRFYLVAMIFIIFDIEIIFLYPWAVVFRKLGPFGLWEMLAFALAVFVSFVYLLGRGALNWGPRKRPVPAAPLAAAPPARSASRSTESTIRRVGGGRQPAGTGAGR